MDELLNISDLYVQYNTDDATVHAVNGVNLVIHKGEAMGLVGETGAGKTTTALSILNILPEKVGQITSGSVVYGGKDVRTMNKRELRAMRGKQISMIFQDPMTSLNPIITVGDQIGEMLKLHFKNMGKEERAQRTDEILRLVGIPLAAVALLKLSGLAHLVPDGQTILLVSLLATCTPSASTITQMAQIYGKDADYASAINVVTTLLCIFTMPLMVALYQL